jgi:hypothetical protein
MELARASRMYLVGGKDGQTRRTQLFRYRFPAAANNALSFTDFALWSLERRQAVLTLPDRTAGVQGLSCAAETKRTAIVCAGPQATIKHDPVRVSRQGGGIPWHGIEVLSGLRHASLVEPRSQHAVGFADMRLAVKVINRMAAGMRIRISALQAARGSPNRRFCF